MATCKDCLHCEACVEMLRALGYTCDGDGQDADKRCGTYASAAEYQELLSTAAKLAVENTVLKDKYKKLLETADILDAALRKYQQKYENKPYNPAEPVAITLTAEQWQTVLHWLQYGTDYRMAKRAEALANCKDHRVAAKLVAEHETAGAKAAHARMIIEDTLHPAPPPETE